MCLALERAEKLAARGTLTETRARQLIGEVVERSTGEPIAFYSVEDWLNEWLRGKQVAKAANTHVKYKQTVVDFLAQLGGRAKLNIAAITATDIARFRDAQIESGKSPNTVRYFVKQLRIPFNAARRAGIITTNPAEAVELPEKVKTEDGAEASRQAFTGEQVTALRKAALAQEGGKLVFDAADEWQQAILFAYYTGARLQDVTKTTWGAVDLPTRIIAYRAKKTGKLVTVPMHPDLEAALLETPTSDSAKAFLFPTLARRSTGGGSGLSMTFSKIMARAGIVSEVMSKAKGAKGRNVRTLTFHSLRHSFNSAMANAGVSQEVRMKLTGHASTEMNAGYTHHELEPLRAAIATIPSVAMPKKRAAHSRANDRNA